MVEVFEEPHVLVYENDFEILKFFLYKTKQSNVSII